MATSQPAAQLCQACIQLKFSALLKLPIVNERQDGTAWMRSFQSSLPMYIPLPVRGARCPVCQLINERLVDHVTEPDWVISIWKSEDLDGGIKALYLFLPSQKEAFMKMTVYADEGTWAARYLPHRPFDGADSMKSLLHIKDWLRECDAHHFRCRYSIAGERVKKASSLPTRVVDVGTRGSPTVRLLTPTDKKARYAALSHCWGGQSLCRTTRETLERYQKSIVLSDLTRTLQDAIYLVRKLKLRYLWVDSLCIIQDDEEDWLREARRMAAVYQQSYLTIAASASKDGSGGCFVSPKTQGLVRVPCDVDDASKGYMYFGVQKDNPIRRLFEGPLNKRAWVLQEHVFARRTLHFAEDQIYWECDKGLKGQDGSDGMGYAYLYVPNRSLLQNILWGFVNLGWVPDGIPDGVVPPEYQGDRAEVYTYWNNLVGYFSSCGLTKASDKLPALLSLSLELERLTTDEYHEGHWFPQDSSEKYMFMPSLLWHSKDKRYLQKLAQFRAPSWSWAALDGPLQFTDKLTSIPVDVPPWLEMQLELLKVELHTPIGLPARKSLFLNGILIRVTTVKQDHPVSPALMAEDCRFCQAFKNLNRVGLCDEDGRDFAGSFTFDTVEKRPVGFWLLPVIARWIAPGREAPGFHVLLVVEVPGQEGSSAVYERIGVGHIEDARMVSSRELEKRSLILI